MVAISLTPFTSLHCFIISLNIASAILFLRLRAAFSSPLFSSITARTLSARSAGSLSLSMLAASLTLSFTSLNILSIPVPVTPSIRLIPAATEFSPMILNRPIFEVLSRCVPPQNSIDAVSSSLPIVTTLTTSPYFSSNRAIAPSF